MKTNRQFQIERLRERLQERQLDRALLDRLHALLKKAEQGDEVALTQLEQLAFERGYQPVPGKDFPLPPGPLLVCPVDPNHYQIFQRDVSERPTCPEHDVALVRSDKPL